MEADDGGEWVVVRHRRPRKAAAAAEPVAGAAKAKNAAGAGAGAGTKATKEKNYKKRAAKKRTKMRAGAHGSGTSAGAAEADESDGEVSGREPDSESTSDSEQEAPSTEGTSTTGLGQAQTQSPAPSKAASASTHAAGSAKAASAKNSTPEAAAEGSDVAVPSGQGAPGRSWLGALGSAVSGLWRRQSQDLTEFHEASDNSNYSSDEAQPAAPAKRPVESQQGHAESATNRQPPHQPQPKQKAAGTGSQAGPAAPATATPTTEPPQHQEKTKPPMPPAGLPVASAPMTEAHLAPSSSPVTSAPAAMTTGVKVQQAASSPAVSAPAAVATGVKPPAGGAATGSAPSKVSGRPAEGGGQASKTKSRARAVDASWAKGKFTLTAHPGGRICDTTAAQGHNELVTAVAVEGAWVLSSGAESTVKLWRWVDDPRGGAAEQLQEVRSLRGHADRVEGVAFVGGGEQTDPVAVTSGRDCSMCVWGLADGAQRRRAYVYESIRSVAAAGAAAAGGAGALLGARSGGISLWDVEAGKQVQSWKGHEGDVTCIEVFRGTAGNPPELSDSLFATGGADHRVRLWDARQAGAAVAPLAELEGLEGRVCAMRTLRGSVLYVGDCSATLKAFDLRMLNSSRTSEPLYRLANGPPVGTGSPGPTAGVELASTPEGSVLLSSAVGFWDADEDAEAEGCVQVRWVGTPSQVTGSSSGWGEAREAYLYTLRPGGGLLTCMRGDGETRIAAGDVNGTVYGIKLNPSASCGGSSRASGLVVPLEGVKLGLSENPLEEDESEDDDEDETR